MSSDTEHEESPTLDVPDWDDEYVDRVSDRLLVNYDLARDYRVRGESFTLYGVLDMESYRQLFHPALSYGRHESSEHLFVRRVERVNRAALKRLAELGHALAEDIDADEEHFSTDFTFAVVVADFDDDVREFVAEFHDRTMLKYGYYGHYEVNLLVVAPETEDLVASQNADVADAFQLWESDEPEQQGLFSRFRGLFG